MKRKLVGMLAALFCVFLVACGDQKSQLTQETTASVFKVVEELGYTRVEDETLRQFPLPVSSEKPAVMYLKGQDPTTASGGLFFATVESSDVVQRLSAIAGTTAEKRGNFTVLQREESEFLIYVIVDEQNKTVLYYIGYSRGHSAEEIKRVKAELDKFK